PGHCTIAKATKRSVLYAPASIAARQTPRACRRIQALCLALVVEDTLVSEDMKCSVGIWNSTA
ncbi:MAG: hypothetical protein ACLSEQ_01170, partial [Bifidobacterium bifidum]